MSWIWSRRQQQRVRRRGDHETVTRRGTVGLAGAIGYSGYCTGLHDAMADPEGTTEKIMHHCVTTLLSDVESPEEDYVESVCKVGNRCVTNM